MKFRYIALLSLTVTSTLLSCTSGTYTPKKYFSKYTYRQYQRNNFYNAGAAPTTGDCHVLVIPIWFTDSANYIHEDKKESVRSDIEKAYFGTHEEVGWHSVASYYEEDSFGKIHIDGVVTPWYEVGQPSTDYYTGERMSSLLVSALSWYKTYSGQSKLTNFDADQDGFLDGVAYIYAAPDSSNMPGVSAENLWGYTSWNTSSRPNVNSPQLKNYFWASYDFMYDRSTALQRAGTFHNRGDNYQNSVDAHCFIHEWGHNFGLPDYYDYNGTNQFAGGFSMQDSNVGAHDPYSRYSLGWIDPYIPTQSCTINLKKIEESGEAILLAPKFTNSCFDEYLMLEYYTPTGLNEYDTNHTYLGRYPHGLNRAGIRIWHVDARLQKYTARGVYKGLTNDPTEPYLYPATSNNSNDGNSINPNFHTLVLIRNNNYADFLSGAVASADDLFYEGDTFTVSKFIRQFGVKNKYNNGSELKWKITVEELNSEYATIKLTK